MSMLCLIDEKLEDKVLNFQYLDSDRNSLPAGSYYYEDFERLSGISLDSWIKVCPSHTCDAKLCVAYDGEKFTCWCPMCSWEPTMDSYNQPDRYYTIPEAVKANPLLSERKLWQLLKEGRLRGRKFSRKGTKPTWHIPANVVNSMKRIPSPEEQRYIELVGVNYG